MKPKELHGQDHTGVYQPGVVMIALVIISVMLMIMICI